MNKTNNNKSFQKGISTVAVSIVLAVLLIVGVGGYFLGQSNSSSVIESSNKVVTSDTKTAETEFTGVEIKPYTVSFARVRDEILLRYKGKIYEGRADESYEVKEVQLSSPDQYKWVGLVHSPIETAESSFFSDELYDFKVLPNKDDFIFIMRWDKNANSVDSKLSQDFKVYYFNFKDRKFSNPLSFNWGAQNNKEYPIPRVNKISSDSKYVQFDMFGCANCGGHYPEKLLLDLEAGKSKRIGKVSFFEWNTDGKYSYKEWFQKECPVSEGMPASECYEDPEKLPLKSGQI